MKILHLLKDNQNRLYVIKQTLPSSGETFKAFHLALGLCLNDYTFKKGKGKKKEKKKITFEI
jgi:hypothetical protein